MKILLAGILGGLGEIGIKEIPHEAAVMSAVQGANPRPGLYLFPGMGLGPNPTTKQQRDAMPEYMKKYEQVPHGMLIYHPPTGPMPFGAMLGKQFTLTVVEALLAALLLSCGAAGRSYLGRVGFVALLGILAALATNSEYWIWYEFPANYTVGYMATQVIGFILAGFVIAALIKSSSAEGSAPVRP